MEAINHTYHDTQFKNPYRSTIAFCNWLKGHVEITGHILVAGCGKGANIFYMQKQFPECHFTGLDLNADFVNEGNAILKQSILEQGNMCEVHKVKRYLNKFDGIMSFQTLSWIPSYKPALSSLAQLNPKWIAFSSLFYDGLVDFDINVHEYHNPSENSFRDSIFNVYSIPKLNDFLKERGYRVTDYTPFEIDIDLPEPEHKLMQTFTKKTADGHRLQFSGALLLPWYFILAERI